MKLSAVKTYSPTISSIDFKFEQPQNIWLIDDIFEVSNREVNEIEINLSNK